MKRLSLGLAIASTLVTVLGNQPSQASDCVNYWTNPNTGQQECLGKELHIVQPSTAPRSITTSPRQTSQSSELNIAPETYDVSGIEEFDESIEEFLKGLEIHTLEGSATGLVNHLKGCQPYRYSFALEFMPNMAISQNVIGDRNGNCSATVSVNMPEMGEEQTVALCNFTPASIATLTDDLAYAEAQALDNNNWSALDKAAPERGSAIFERDCQEVS